MEPESPPGLFLLGGQSTDGQLASIETFGFDNCSIPPLPETRYGFGSFITPTEPPQLAVCGGWWTGKPISTDCLTLNLTSGQWVDSRRIIFPKYHHRFINFEIIFKVWLPASTSVLITFFGVGDRSSFFVDKIF